VHSTAKGGSVPDSQWEEWQQKNEEVSNISRVKLFVDRFVCCFLSKYKHMVL